MDKAKIISSIKQPFTNPWNYLVLTIFFSFFTLYTFENYSIAHWRIGHAGVMMQMNIEAMLHDNYENVLSEQDRATFMKTCRTLNDASSTWYKEIASRLTEEHAKELGYLCELVKTSGELMATGDELMGRSVYTLYSLLAAISAFICIIVSVRKKKPYLGLIAGLFALYSGQYLFIIM